MKPIHIHVTNRFELWVLVAVVVMCTVWVGFVTHYLLTDSSRRCHAINDANHGNRDAWQFTEDTIKAQWLKHPPTKAERAQVNAFFAGVRRRLAPLNC